MLIPSRGNARDGEHTCCAWCRDGRHAEVSHTDVASLARARLLFREVWERAYEMEVIEVEVAHEAPPPGEPATTIDAHGDERRTLPASARIYHYLVWFSVDD